jgi:hypothetical protein
MKVQLMAGIDSRGPRHGGGVSGPRHPLGQVGRGAGRAFEVLPRRRVVGSPPPLVLVMRYG